MVSTTTQPRLLVKVASGQKLPGAADSFSVASGDFKVKAKIEPLMRAQSRRGLTARGPGQWWLAELDMQSLGAAPPPVNAWDLCHDLVRKKGTLGGAKIEFAEPDLEQQWPAAGPNGGSKTDGLSFGGSGDPDAPASPQDQRYHARSPDDWFRDNRHSQLDQARSRIGAVGDDERVAIAHFDTGYDPHHLTLPRHIDHVNEVNFVDENFPNDAKDRTDGLFNMLGHGTGTLGILAGKSWGSTGAGSRDLGGAPFARIVPIRVANSVVLFRTSAIAKAFDHVTGLAGSASARVDVVTMSMGGLASQAWAEAINRAYEKGIYIVTAAGNNYGNLPTRFLVYPARFNRVIGACGVQARNGNTLVPYADLPVHLMAGNYGPNSKVDEALAAFTPNIPWARIHGIDKVDLDGGGTSSATPQIAASAANWIQHHRDQLAQYSKLWMRVEAVRHAQFASALFRNDHDDHDRKYFGRGIVQANDAMDIQPPAENALTMSEPDNARFAFIRGIGGLGVAGNGREILEPMLELELLQAVQSIPEMSDTLGDPDDPAGRDVRFARLKEALAEARGDLSASIGAWLDTTARPSGTGIRKTAAVDEFITREQVEKAKNPKVDPPPTRRLRVYTSDPAAETDTGTRPTAYTVVHLPWADVKQGPVDEYFEIVDVDPSASLCYAPVDLNDPYLLATDGLAPSESDPRFHQQMVFAVARKTVEHFEYALGRPALWSPRQVRIGGKFHDHFVRRLRVYPHALREANAYYSPLKKALLFGYFREDEDSTHGIVPGSVVFTCLSYDIIAHETAHAMLDGLHRRYSEISNSDARAFHEAFSDLVALFQHFTHDDVLRSSIARAQREDGDFDKQITDLAEQFGWALGNRAALRSALGRDDKGGLKSLQTAPNEPHARGAVLVAAVFDAFLDIYRRRSADLIRIATQGSGILPDGEMHPDLVNRLAREAAKTAGHMLRMVIRALDYCPPVSITFGEYLRALITSDLDLFPDDTYDYRTAIVSAFRRRGIHPRGVRSLSADSLRWYRPAVDDTLKAKLRLVFKGIDAVEGFPDWKLETERGKAYQISSKASAYLAVALREAFTDNEASLLGFSLKDESDEPILGEKRKLSRFEVHSVRPARRTMQNGQEYLDLVVEITQSCRIPGEGGSYRGGATWIVNADSGEIRYIVWKRATSARRIGEEHAYRQSLRSSDRWNYYGGTARPAEPFALVHRGDEEVD